MEKKKDPSGEPGPEIDTSKLLRRNIPTILVGIARPIPQDGIGTFRIHVATEEADAAIPTGNFRVGFRATIMWGAFFGELLFAGRAKMRHIEPPKVLVCGYGFPSPDTHMK